MTLEDSLVCIVGLGYVGLPLAQAFAQKLRVVGFDLDKQKVFTLQSFPGDRPLTTDDQNDNLTFTANPEKIKKADFLLFVCPPQSPKQNFLTSPP
jgi:UDP-N-acetyl-D-mannosaminuronate dehydrogenase